MARPLPDRVRRGTFQCAALALSALLSWPLPSAALPRVPMDAPLAQTSAGAGGLARAQAQIESGEFEKAVRTLRGVLREPGLPEAHRVRGYRLQGLAYLYLGDEGSARQSYERLLRVQPDYELPLSAPPKIQALFARIKRDVQRRSSASPPPPPPSAPPLPKVEALPEASTPLAATVDTPPPQVASAAAEGRSWFRNPWVWAGAGAAVVAITVVAVVLLNSGGAETPDRSGTVPVRIQVRSP